MADIKSSSYVPASAREMGRTFGRPPQKGMVNVLGAGTHFLPSLCFGSINHQFVDAEAVAHGDSHTAEHIFLNGVTLSTETEVDSVEVTLVESQLPEVPFRSRFYISALFSRSCDDHGIEEHQSEAFKPLLPGRTQTFELSRHLSLSEREAKLQTELDDMRDVPSYARHDYQNDHDDEEEESVFLNLSIDVLAEAIFMGTELDRASDLHETLGSFVPRFWHHGVSDTVRAPQEGDTVRQLVLRGVKSPEIVATTAEEAPQGTVTRPRKTRAVAAPSQVAASETISIGFSKALYTKLGIEKIMNALDDSLLPTSSIIGYLITLHGGILHMSYPPTLDELVLYCHVYHLHQTLGTCGGLVEQTLFQVLFSLSWFPGFGVVAIGTLNELMRRLFLDTSANENLIQAVGSLYQTKEQYVQLLRHLGPLVIEYPEKVVLLLMEKPKRSISAPVARMEAPSFEMTGNLKP